MKNKYLPIKKEDLQGKYDYNLSLKDTVSYVYFFKKVKGVVYRFSMIGKGEWKVDETPFNEEPYHLI